MIIKFHDNKLRPVLVLDDFGEFTMIEPSMDLMIQPSVDFKKFNIMKNTLFCINGGKFYMHLTF